MNRKIDSTNTSGYKGVAWRERDRVWRANITVDSKQIHLGHFKNKEDAIKARKEAEEKYFGEFASKEELDVGN
jgi:hypothetical protein